MNVKLGYTILIISNLFTIFISLYSIVINKKYEAFLSLGIGSLFLYLSIKEINRL